MSVGLFRDDETLRSGFGQWWESRFAVGPVTIPELIRPSGGRSNETVLAVVKWNGGSERVAIRLPTLVPSFPDYDLWTQSRLHSVLLPHGIPMARLVAYEVDTRWFGAPFMVMRAEEGRSVGDAPALDRWLAGCPTSVQRHVEDVFIDVLARIHLLDPHQLDIGSNIRGGTGAGGISVELDWWGSYLDWSAQSDAVHPRLQSVLDWCMKTKPLAESPPCLCWGDARIGNVLYMDNGDVSAVLDWELASIGPAEMDVAWFLVLDELFEELSNKRVPGFRNRASVLATYENRLGRELNDLHWHKVFALLRTAAVTDRQARTARALGTPYPGVDVEHNPVVRKAERLIAEFDNHPPG